MTRGALTAGLAVLLGGCGTELPDPVVHSVDPTTFDEGDAPVLRVDFDAIRPQWVDFGDRSAGMDTGIDVLVGGQSFFAAESFNENQVIARAPFGMKPGTWDVSVVMGDGRQGTLIGGLTVMPHAFPTAYRIESVGDQVPDQPFNLTLHAEGGGAPTYTGVVRLSVNKGTITPEFSGAFSEGSRIERVSVSGPGNNVVITVEDSAGALGTSNPFQVKP